MATEGTSARPQPDTDEMVLVHRLFRRELGAAPRLVGRCAEGDLARVRRVAAHLDVLGRMLHVHHEAEDELIWPRLTADATVDPKTVARMEEQHSQIATGMAEIGTLLGRWGSAADRDSRDRLAAAYAALLPVLDEHLTDEEQLVLPLVPGRFTAEEWGLLSERGRDAVPGNRKLYMLGAMLHDADEAQRAVFLSRLPAAVRLLWLLIGRRVYQRSVTRLSEI